MASRFTAPPAADTPLPLSGDLQPIAGELAHRAGQVADTVMARVVSAVPELIEDCDPISVDAAFHGVEANVGAVLSMLTYRVPCSAIEPPRAVLELFELLADREDGLGVILRVQRVAIAELWQIWAQHLRAAAVEPAKEHEMLAASTAFMFLYLDRVSDQLASRWADTRRRRQQGLDVPPEELIRRALFGGEAEDAGLGRLGYDTQRFHVALALPPSLDEAEVARLASRARLELRAESLSMSHNGGWILWLALQRLPTEESVARIEAAFSLNEPVGRGGTAAGIKGFRATYREALDAQRVGLLRHTKGVTHYRDVSLLAVLCADTERARALARSELGPLAINDEVTERLRETLTAYLACGESHVAAAQLLYCHKKTVSYRVKQAETLLGRKVSERRAELEAALLLHRAFDGNV